MVLVDNLPWPPPQGQVGTGGLSLGHHSQPGHGVLWSGARTVTTCPHTCTSWWMDTGPGSQRTASASAQPWGSLPPEQGMAGSHPRADTHALSHVKGQLVAPCQALWTVCQVTYGTDLAQAAGRRRPAAPSTQIGAVSANALSRRERSARRLSKHLQRGSCTGTE